jgi:hypothetical protein
MIVNQRPRLLYKYYSPERLDIFNNWTVRFSNPMDFNDAFETSWPDTHDLSQTKLLDFRRSLGIFCLTETPDDHLMWVHYAARHKGFAVGFRTGDELFSDAGGELRKVRYEPCPSNIMPPSKEVCLYKDENWTHEKEWRCIRLIEREKPRDIALPPQEVAEVIIGSQMSDSHITSILQSFDPGFGIALNISRLNGTTRTITHERYRRSLCTLCNGLGQINNS